jgi:putative heme-binding domain-containing protein
LIDQLDAGVAKQRAHLDELVDSLKDGDVRRGQAVFQKAGCVQCHAMGYLGGNLGPDLTHIGKIRVERDLLESIVYPSASFVRSYEPMSVTTKSGDQFNGILRKDAPDEVVLAVGPDAEQHIARGDISEMRPGTVSLMPQGFEQALAPQDLADLIAFLKAAK